MASVSLVVVVVLTSVAAYLAATRRMGLRRAEVRGAVMQALDCLGLVVLFLLGNLILGLVLILGIRVVTGHFVSMYMLNDATLAIISLVQAVIFHCWKDRAR